MPDTASHPWLRSILGDLRDRELVEATMREGGFDAVFHCAVALAHGLHVDAKDIWTSNVDGTWLLAEAASRHGAPKFVFISTNCRWAQNLGHPVAEDETLQPVKIYVESKWSGEKCCASSRVSWM